MSKRIAIATVIAWTAFGGIPAGAQCEYWNELPLAKLTVENNTTVPLLVYVSAPGPVYPQVYEKRLEIAPLTEATARNALLAGRNKILLAVVVDGRRYEKTNTSDVIVQNAGPATCEHAFKIIVRDSDFAGVIFPANVVTGPTLTFNGRWGHPHGMIVRIEGSNGYWEFAGRLSEFKFTDNHHGFKEITEVPNAPRQAGQKVYTAKVLWRDNRGNDIGWRDHTFVLLDANSANDSGLIWKRCTQPPRPDRRSC